MPLLFTPRDSYSRMLHFLQNKNHLSWKWILRSSDYFTLEFVDVLVINDKIWFCFINWPLSALATAPVMSSLASNSCQWWRQQANLLWQITYPNLLLLLDRFYWDGKTEGEKLRTPLTTTSILRFATKKFTIQTTLATNRLDYFVTEPSTPPIQSC